MDITDIDVSTNKNEGEKENNQIMKKKLVDDVLGRLDKIEKEYVYDFIMQDENRERIKLLHMAAKANRKNRNS